MKKYDNFCEMLANENFLYLNEGHATKILDDEECTVWNVWDYQSEQCYLLVDDEALDLEPLIHHEWYELKMAIQKTKNIYHK